MVTSSQAAPIFIVGAPRSGTTMLRTILNRHPQIALCDETHYFYYVYTRRRAFGDLRDTAARRYLVKEYLATYRVRRLNLNANKLSEILMQEGDSYASFFLALIRFYACNQEKIRYGEKTPDHAKFSETLCDWYPDCKLIHLVRDPRDVVASLLQMPWGSTSILNNARYWQDCVLGAHRCCNRKNYLLVRYENLVIQPEQELERICGFIGVDFFNEMLQTNKKAAVDKWWFERAQGKVSAERLGLWRKQLTPQQVALVEWLVGSQMKEFGYETSDAVATKANIITALGGEMLDWIYRRRRKLPAMWHYWMRPTHLAAEEVYYEN